MISRRLDTGEILMRIDPPEVRCKKALPDGYRRPQQIPARSGDTLTIRIAGDTNVIELVVDGDGPDDQRRYACAQHDPGLRTCCASHSRRVTRLSGLRHDAEQVLSEGPNYPMGDSDPTVSNLDKDNFESNEPISDPDGRSTDINVWYRA